MHAPSDKQRGRERLRADLGPRLPGRVDPARWRVGDGTACKVARALPDGSVRRSFA